MASRGAGIYLRGMTWIIISIGTTLLLLLTLASSASTDCTLVLWSKTITGGSEIDYFPFETYRTSDECDVGARDEAMRRSKEGFDWRQMPGQKHVQEGRPTSIVHLRLPPRHRRSARAESKVAALQTERNATADCWTTQRKQGGRNREDLRMSEHNATPSFARKDVNSFAELAAEVGHTAETRKSAGVRGSLAFRGYNTMGNALATGLERTCIAIDGGLTSARQREIALIREFRRRAHHYLSDVPEPRNWLEWLALMQHHGAPTRLLDWTYSLHVATHFAVSHVSPDDAGHLAIWMIDTTWCREASTAVGEREKCTIGELSGHLMRSGDENLRSSQLLAWKLAPTVWPVNPFRLNERLTLQKGVFLACGDPTKSFVQNLQALDGFDKASNVTEFVVPRSQLPTISRELYNANVTEATLFPGLDGFARSLRTSLRFLSLYDLQSLDDI